MEQFDAAKVIPNLTTSLSGPLLALEKQFLERQIAIETWFRKAWVDTPAPIQSSVDLRNAGYKLAPVDTNLFPGGFNNLSPDTMPLCIQAAQATFDIEFPGCEKILLVPENHTRNIFYMENIATLKDILKNAGFQIRVGTLLPEITEPLNVDLPSGKSLTLEPIKRENDTLFTENFRPCIVMLNNDLAEGTPELLKNITQSIRPPLQLGWSERLKSSHFAFYAKVTQRFADDIGIDSWYLNPSFTTVDNVDFNSKDSLVEIAEAADKLLTEIGQNYRARNITAQPFVMVKSDSGTYGMSVLPVTDAKSILTLNRKERSKMSAQKGKGSVERVIIQEGVPSVETVGPENAVAEPVVYMLGHHVVGGFYRIHKDKRDNENLNSPGMQFEPLAFKDACNTPDKKQDPDSSLNRFYAYSVVARLALLAAAHELKEVNSGN